MRRDAACLGAAVAIGVVVAAFAHAPANAVGAPAAFKRGATLVEFFEFPKTTGDGAANKCSTIPSDAVTVRS